jgi:cell fate regulator YaaT (PSP1 superfamily)
MPTVVGVKLKFTPKVLWFDPAGTSPEEGDRVVVETERGTELGIVAKAPFDVEASELVAPLKPVVRIANDDDLARAEELAEREREAMPVFRELVAEHKLDMKPIDVEYLFGGDKVVFYFVAEERVDFRELVRELASRFRSRIDMRQIGVRDEARMVGGLGHCGQQLCCVRFGGEFQPVSIRMAKEQDLPLNPLKISGLCGRLMCCLRYEYEAYRDYKSRAPKRGAIIDTPLGLAKVSDLNTPHETVELRLEDGKRATVALADMECCKGTGCPCSVSAEVLDAAMGGQSILTVPSASAAEPAKGAPAKANPEPQAPQREGRKRRRRSSKGGSEGAAQTGAAQAASPAKEGQAAQAAKGGKSAQPTKEGQAAQAAGQPKSGRRRRRRRSGSGEGSATPPSA